jgi:hypothetical protein
VHPQGPYSPGIGDTVPDLAPVRAGPLPELGAICAAEGWGARRRARD